MTKKKGWSYGDTKKDKKGRIIYFVGYSSETSKSGDLIELWEPKSEYLKRVNK